MPTFLSLCLQLIFGHCNFNQTCFTLHPVYQKTFFMRKITAAAAIIISGVLVLLFDGCRKSGPELSKPVTMGTTIDQLSDLVPTPGGWIPRSRVFLIEEGFHVSIFNGRLAKVETRTGKIVQDLGEYQVHIRQQNMIDLNQRVPPPADSGWIAWTSASPDSSNGGKITSFSTTWLVPKPPADSNSQLIYLFNGLQAGTGPTRYIVQPVLQWGVSPAGGGKYWAITNWYVQSNNFAIHGKLVKVTSGTSLTGVITFLKDSGTNVIYKSTFTGYGDSTSATTPPVLKANELDETLEAFGITKPATQYPPDSLVRMKNISIWQGASRPTITWAPHKATGVIPKAVVVSNSSTNGEVDIYFR